MALTHTPPGELGMKCPDFQLPSVDGISFGLKNIAKGTPFVVMFICNHCPYVKAIEDRLIQLGLDLAKEQIPVIGICSNDSKNYPEDSFENLKKRFFDKKYSFVYLHDEDQSVAKKFGAVCTPDFFIFDGDQKLAYRGRLDDSWKEPEKVTSRELFNAALVIKAHQVPQNQISSMGCSIKWVKS